MKVNYWLMLLLLVAGASFANATDIKLTITYNGAGVAGNDITVKVGDAVLGKGRTDKEGNVTVSAPASFPRNIDVYGYVATPNGEKKWDLKGWVVLDDNNYSHIKMEEVLAEMGGMGMPTSMIAEAWGLVFSTQGNAAPSSGGDSQTNAGNSPTEVPSGGTPPPPPPATPQLPAGYKCKPISGTEFSNKKAAVEKASFGSDKLKQAESIIQGSCLESVQVKELVSLITMGTDKLNLAKFGYDYVANPGGYSVVEEALTMELDKKELRKYIEGKQNGGQPSGNANAGGAQTNLPPTVPPGANYTLTVFTEAGEPFYLTVDGVRQNTVPMNRVSARWVNAPGKRPHFMVEFEDKNIPGIDQKVLVGGYSDTANYKIKKDKKGEYVLRLQAN